MLTLKDPNAKYEPIDLYSQPNEPNRGSSALEANHQNGHNFQSAHVSKARDHTHPLVDNISESNLDESQPPSQAPAKK